MGNLTRLGSAVTPPTFPNGVCRVYGVYETESGTRVCRYEGNERPGCTGRELLPEATVRNMAFIGYDPECFARNPV